MKSSELLDKLLNHLNLTELEASQMMTEILNGNLTPIQTAGFLTALRSKGESFQEIIGFVKALRNSMVKVSCKSSIVIDTCGTGGDGAGSFNISTASSFVVAGAGLTVAKHGNRSVSSLCGSADVLEALGVKIDMSKDVAERCLNEIGITFLFAPLYHPAMKNVAPVRKELGVRTVFNMLGPLINPAGANVQVIGVSQPAMIPLMSKVLQGLMGEKGCSLVLHDSGTDEWLLTNKAQATLIRDGKIKTEKLSEKLVRIKRIHSTEISGGDAKKNAQMITEIFSGSENGAKNIVVANAALAIHCARSLEENKKYKFQDAAQEALESINSGKALKKLKELVEWSQKS